jgi:hypothetical protein
VGTLAAPLFYWLWLGAALVGGIAPRATHLPVMY